MTFCDPPSPATRVYCPACPWVGRLWQAARVASVAECPDCKAKVLRHPADGPPERRFLWRKARCQ